MKNIFLSLVLTQLFLLPLARKWELDMLKVIVGGIGIGLLAGIIAELLAWLAGLSQTPQFVVLVILILAISFISFTIWFFRDPERIPPVAQGVVVAPADGTIKYIKRVDRGQVALSTKGRESVRLGAPLTDILPEQKGYLLGIAMTFLDVHVTRAPICGKTSFAQHVKGSFFSLKEADAPYRNERMIQIIANEQMSVGLVHIASRLVRRIRSYVHAGEYLQLGQRIGIIKFGSQVDVLLPDDGGLIIRVGVGDRVFAGTTIIARKHD